MKTVLFVSAVLFSSVAMAQGPKIGEVDITNFSADGKGCPAGSTGIIVTNSVPGSKAADYLQVSYDKFLVESGPETTTRDQRTNCNLSFVVKYPEGYRFYFASLNFDGFAELERGTDAEFQTSIRAPFGSKISYKTLLRGPYDGDFGDNETGKTLEKFKTECDGSASISISNKLRMKGDTKQEGKVGVDVGSASVRQGLVIKWEKC